MDEVCLGSINNAGEGYTEDHEESGRDSWGSVDWIGISLLEGDNSVARRMSCRSECRSWSRSPFQYALLDGFMNNCTTFERGP